MPDVRRAVRVGGRSGDGQEGALCADLQPLQTTRTQRFARQPTLTRFILCLIFQPRFPIFFAYFFLQMNSLYKLSNYSACT